MQQVVETQIVPLAELYLNYTLDSTSTRVGRVFVSSVTFNLPVLNLLATYPALYQNKSNEVKSKLLLLAQNEEEARTKSSCDKQQGDNLHTPQNKINRPLGTEITQATTQVDYNYSQVEFKNKMEKFIESTNFKILYLKLVNSRRLKVANCSYTLTNNDENLSVSYL